MRKGFVFSIDAAMALVAVMVIALLFATQFQVVDSGEAYQASERAARDYAIVGSYLGQPATAEAMGGYANYACIEVYEYGPIQIDDVPSAIGSKKYCKGIG